MHTYKITTFNDRLDDTDFNEIYDINCRNKARDEFINKYNTILDETIPIKTSKFNRYKRNINPWATQGIRNSVKHRDRLHMKMKKAKSDTQRKKN